MYSFLPFIEVRAQKTALSLGASDECAPDLLTLGFNILSNRFLTSISNTRNKVTV